MNGPDGCTSVAWLGEQRVGLLSGLPALVAEFGVPPGRLAEAAGVTLAQLADREAMIPFVAMGRLLAAAVAMTGREDIGLLLGKRTDTISVLGLVGQLMREAPDLRTALEDLATQQRRYVNGAVIYLLRGETEAFLGYAVHRQAVQAIPQILDAAMAAGVNLLRGLGGIVPSEIQLARTLPCDPAAYRRVLGVPVRFDASQSALVLDARLLRRPIPGANAARRRTLEEAVAAWWAVHPPGIVADVIRILLPRIAWGAATLDSTAALLGMRPRTLERRLQEKRTSFRVLLGEVQLDVAGQLLRCTHLRVAAIGEALGYCDPSAFGRWFRNATGEAPARWRERADAAVPPSPRVSENHHRVAIDTP